MEIRYVKAEDKDFWFRLDRHLPETEFDRKGRDRMGYILSEDDSPAALLRYHLFWDNTPFCTLLYISEKYRNNGYGKQLMNFWESDMLSLGYNWLLVSTQSDESAQYFYKALGYQDCGKLFAPNQPMELFLGKHLKNTF